MHLPEKDSFPLRNDLQLLEAVSSKYLMAMNRHWGGRNNEAKTVSISNMLRVWDEPATIRAMIEKADAIERATLVGIKDHGGVIRVSTVIAMLQAWGYTLPKDRHGSRWSRNEDANYISGLIKHGWVLFMPRRAAYVSPYADLDYHRLSPEATIYTDCRILDQLTQPPEIALLDISPAPAPPSSTARRPPRIMLDLLSVLQTLRALPPFTLTRAQAIRQNDYRKFLKGMNWQDTQQIDGLAFHNIGDATLATWCHLGWLQRREDSLTLSLAPEQLARFSVAQLVSRLIGAFLDVSDWHEVESFAYRLGELQPARALVYYALRALPDQTRWYALDDFVAALYERVGQTMTSLPGFRQPMPIESSEPEHQYAIRTWWREHRAYWLNAETSFLTATLSSWLYWLGLLEIGARDTGDLTFRLTGLAREVFARQGEKPEPTPDPGTETEPAAGHAGPRWVVQPNYDIIVYLDAVSPKDLIFLEGHAERRQTEAHTAHYQVTRESVYRGLQSGTSVEDLLAMLLDGARQDLPRNVEREIRDWAGQREQLTVHTHARLIEFPSVAAREEALTAALPGTPIGDTFVLAEDGAPLDTALRMLDAGPSLLTIDYARPLPHCLRLLEDGTLTLTAEANDLLLPGQLACFAERQSAEQWSITPTSLANARAAGVSAGSVLAVLHARALAKVPPLLEAFVRHALGTRAVVQGEAVFALRIPDKALYTAIITSAAMQVYLWDVCPPNIILVRRNLLEEFRAKMDWLGVTIRSD